MSQKKQLSPELRALVEKMRSATKVTVHPDMLEDVTAKLKGIAAQIPNLMKPGAIVSAEHVPMGQILVSQEPLPEPELDDEPEDTETPE